jgi:hypothetical protein
LRDGAAQSLSEAVVQRLADALADSLDQVLPNDLRDPSLNGVRQLFGIESSAEQGLLDERFANGAAEMAAQRFVEPLFDDGPQTLVEGLADAFANVLGHPVA